VKRTLRQQDYGRLKRGGKGLVRRYIAKMSGLSRAPAASLIRSHPQGRGVKRRAYRRHRFAQRYTRADIEVLAAVEEAHETLSGSARPRRRFCSGPGMSFRMQVRTACACSRWPSSSGCERKGRPASAASPIHLADPRGWRSENGAGPIRKGDRDICAWTACIQVTGRSQGAVSHPRCGRSDAMASSGRTAPISEAWLMPVLETILA
jgi:hypothetical protein